ncbi:MAG: terpene cyclase/mutase family protein [Candidatus Eremiobacteraeota bacterium]|nr:terpene cyclase/mutase family protein [Candidatus Eremiobacteraeota bacterium]
MLTALAAPVAHALDRAVRYVVEAQSPDGAWRDFELDRTQSDAWVTAYVGLGLLAAVPFAGRSLLRSDTLRGGGARALDAARAWLTTACDGRDGWGFNGHAPVDADSTAFGTAFLAATGGAPPAVYDTLRRHRHDDGGYSCYEHFSDVSTWAISHADVSAMALRALLSEPERDGESVETCAEYLLANQRDDGSWPSYWYATRLYSVACVLGALAECDPSLLDRCRVGDAVRFALRDVHRDDAFALSFALEVVARFGEPADAAPLVDALLALQRIDGRFTAAAPFMQPDPWNYPPGDPQAAILDPYGLFTTATALRALSVAEAVRA